MNGNIIGILEKTPSSLNWDFSFKKNTCNTNLDSYNYKNSQTAHHSSSNYLLKYVGVCAILDFPFVTKKTWVDKVLREQLTWFQLSEY